MGLFGPKSPGEERLKELTGGFLVHDDYMKILEGNGLSVAEGEDIRETVKKEIKRGSLKTDDILDRLDYLIKEKARSKGFEPKGYDVSILYPNISALNERTEDLSDKTINELMIMIPQFCTNCGHDTKGIINVFCPKCLAYIWNPISDEVFRRIINDYLKFAEILDNEYHKELTAVNELKSKGFSIHSIFLSEYCSFLCYLAAADNIISDAEIKFINEYLHLDFNKKQISDFARTLDENYENALPLQFIIYHEIETQVDNSYRIADVRNFYAIAGDLFLSCDGNVDPKEKIKFGIYLNKLGKNIQKLKAGRYELDKINYKQQNAINLIERQKNKNNIKTNFCTKCGFENRPNVKFCTKCGNKMI